MFDFFKNKKDLVFFNETLHDRLEVTEPIYNWFVETIYREASFFEKKTGKKPSKVILKYEIRNIEKVPGTVLEVKLPNATYLEIRIDPNADKLMEVK